MQTQAEQFARAREKAGEECHGGLYFSLAETESEKVHGGESKVVVLGICDSSVWGSPRIWKQGQYSLSRLKKMVEHGMPSSIPL